MQQYLDLLKIIKEKGTHKPAARAGMPGTTSLFGYQFRHNLQDGFPLLTTKKMFWKGIVVELLWFLRGDTNIKFLVDNGVNIWNEDAYNYYLKLNKKLSIISDHNFPMSFDNFIEKIKKRDRNNPVSDFDSEYTLGDCGYQYGKVWRNWVGGQEFSHYEPGFGDLIKVYRTKKIDQIKNVINSLKNNPESRRHIVTAIDPAHDQDLALYWCHAMFQFNCRPLTVEERFSIWFNIKKPNRDVVDYYDDKSFEEITKMLDEDIIPKYHLDCQLYQRSADVVLGVPFNIASYALLIHIIAQVCNMIPGEFIHTFGDVHIYDDHMEAVNEQLTRIPGILPTLRFSDEFKMSVDRINGKLPIFKISDIFEISIETYLNNLTFDDFILDNYYPQPPIKAKLSTGLH